MQDWLSLGGMRTIFLPELYSELLSQVRRKYACGAVICRSSIELTFQCGQWEVTSFSSFSGPLCPPTGTGCHCKECFSGIIKLLSCGAQFHSNLRKIDLWPSLFGTFQRRYNKMRDTHTHVIIGVRVTTHVRDADTLCFIMSVCFHCFRGLVFHLHVPCCEYS